MVYLNLDNWVTGNIGPKPNRKIIASTSNVVRHLQRLEEIAADHGDSRSVINGHGASVKYVVENLERWNSTFKVWTQAVPLNVQVDDEPPQLTIFPNKYSNLTLRPRLDVAVARGSGPVSLEGAPLIFIDSCAINIKKTNWVAVIDATPSPEDTPLCNACERLMSAIREGCRGAILIHRSGQFEGYPHPLAPQPGRCGRNPKYLDRMKQIGVVSLSDEHALNLLKLMVVNHKIKVNLKVVSVYREFISHNVLAETINGDENKIAFFGCHLDSVPAGPGINDDGSGAMGTLELARALHDSELSQTTVQKIRFGWWTGEEIGLLGSRYYMNDLQENHPEEVSYIKLNIDTDMIASPNYVRGVWDGSSIPDQQSEVAVKSRTLHELFRNHFKSKDLPIFSFPFNGRSDFQPFLDAGIPAGGVITGEDEIKSVESAALFGGVSGMVLDPCYHQDCDRVASIRGSGEVILEQNMEALAVVLETVATAEDIDSLLLGK
ncbi:hypothetical protein BC833DRAFT_578679 [Globomyces pollinis-pini]|nr:hypothetical protein BC833DRAFT_578679 [Globomyces pollinis-pini]